MKDSEKIQYLVFNFWYCVPPSGRHLLLHCFCQSSSINYNYKKYTCGFIHKSKSSIIQEVCSVFSGSTLRVYPT